MSKKITVLIDGGHLRSYLKMAHKAITADYIEKIGIASALVTEEIIRVLYYDCALFNGSTRLPVSRTVQNHAQSTPYLHDLAKKDLFAVRRGVLKFRGYVVKKGNQPSNPPVDADFVPKFQRKGVDMRIGLDMATIAGNRSVELIALMTNDTDYVPAMKLIRRAGVQVALLCIPGCRPAQELLAHTDFKRTVPWP
ncbi:MAG: NYN domain-containing protein [Bryobacteraceae bacterium]